MDVRYVFENEVRKVLSIYHNNVFLFFLPPPLFFHLFPLFCLKSAPPSPSPPPAASLHTLSLSLSGVFF